MFVLYAEHDEQNRKTLKEKTKDVRFCKYKEKFIVNGKCLLIIVMS